MSWLTAYTHAAAELHPGPEIGEACCVYARRMTELVHGTAAIARAPLALWILFADSGDPWGPVNAVVQAGLAAGPVLSDLPADGRWYRAQGWRGTPFAPGVSGHTFTAFRDVGRTTTRILDAAAGRAGNGEGNRVVDWPGFATQFTGGIRVVALQEP